MAENLRLSPWRVLIAVVVPIALAAGGFFAFHAWNGDRVAKEASNPLAAGTAWSAPYVDATATPLYEFEDPDTGKGRDVVLSFIVAAADGACEPTWGAAYSLDDASTAIDLDRRIARLRQLGGDVAISFGGQANTDLALACSDSAVLADAYRQVVDRYQVLALDFDIEGSALSDRPSIERRASALAELQKSLASQGRKLAVWLTLPVGPDGLPAEAQDVIRVSLALGVDIAGVNLMTMDYGGSAPLSEKIVDLSERAVTASATQLGDLYAQLGRTLSATAVRAKLGLTPMIGRNDDGRVLDIQQAKALNAFARKQGLARVSMWSANRDRPCGVNYPDVTVVSDSCSGLDETTAAFATALGKGYATKARLTSDAPTPTTPPVEEDDPAHSPYEIWADDIDYPEGTKVVWHHYVYVAKWWNSGQAPDDPSLDEWQTPWRLVGPVLPGESPAPLPTLPKGTFPDWKPSKEYEAGSRVLLDGVPYQARWWTQGERPTTRLTPDSTSAWRLLTSDEIAAVKKSLSVTH